MGSGDKYVLPKDSTWLHWLFFVVVCSSGGSLMTAEETQSVSYHVNVSMLTKNLLSIQTPPM